MALPIRSIPPQQRGLTLIHSRRSRARGGSSDSGASSEDELKSDAHGLAAPLDAPARSSTRSTRSTDVTDGDLVALARVGETKAFEQLYRKHAAYALSLAVRVQGHVGDAEDIVHDAFLKVHGRLNELRADSSFRPWLAAIVVSLVRTRLRRRRMLALLGLAPSEPVDLDALVHTDAGPEVRAQLAQVYSVLNEVAVESRICWTLRYIEGRKLEEVAQVARCSLATAKRRIASVQERLLGLEGIVSSQDDVRSDDFAASLVSTTTDERGSAP